MGQPQQNRSPQYRPDSVPAREGRHKLANGREEQHQISDVANKSGKPIAPRRVKPHEITETRLGVSIDAIVKIRATNRQFLVDHRQADHTHPGNDPANDHRPWTRGSGNVLRKREDPSSNHGTNDKCQHRRKGQLFNIATALYRSSLACRVSDLRSHFILHHLSPHHHCCDSQRANRLAINEE